MDLDYLQKLKRQNGLYFLYNNDELVYIGQSKSVYTRVLEHIVDNKKTFNDVTALYHEDVTNSEIMEIALIYLKKPKYNKLVIQDIGKFLFLLPSCVGEFFKNKENVLNEAQKIIQLLEDGEPSEKPFDFD